LSILEIKGLTHTYNSNSPFINDAVSNVSLTIEKGEIIGIIGHTGSGKSTLVQHLNGLLKPTDGSVLLEGKDIWENPKEIRKIRSRVGLVFQYPEYQLFEETVFEDIAFGPKNMGLSEEEIDERVRKSASLVGIKEKHLDRSPFDLSGGQKRRVAIAGVIAMKPEVLILDEPTAGLNPKAHADILDMVKTIHSAENNIIFLVSHNMNDIAALCDKVLVMDHGRLVMDGTPQEVFSRGAELKKMGLDIPDAMEMLSILSEAGLDVNTDCLTMDEAADEILKVLKK